MPTVPQKATVLLPHDGRIEQGFDHRLDMNCNTEARPARDLDPCRTNSSLPLPATERLLDLEPICSDRLALVLTSWRMPSHPVRNDDIQLRIVAIELEPACRGSYA